MSEEFLFPGTQVNPNEEVVNLIRSGISRLDGHCPCIPKHAHNEDTICPCKPYRTGGQCKCALYVMKA